MKSRDAGLVFDIHRFSLNDGPGIRTTVFLKGCPLHCEWCHNPESQSYVPQLSFNPDKCMDCFECVKACPNGVHQNLNGKHVVNWENCTTSGECVKVCAYDALKIIGDEYRISEIINEVIKDKKYYDKSGGGITISGGEPLAQFEFTKALLIAAKGEGIHTCVDTCGMTTPDNLKEILPYADLFLFDYKLTDNSKHKALTGAGNKQVLKSLDFLIEHGANVILRCPLIPDINDEAEHLNGIADIIKKYPALKGVELIPYHSMGRDKAGHIGKEYIYKDIPNTSEEQKFSWMQYYNAKGITEPFLIIR
jgi:glycyl-radical enzyme activating protein